VRLINQDAIDFIEVYENFPLINLKINDKYNSNKVA
jgi:hypothetical protein